MLFPSTFDKCFSLTTTFLKINSMVQLLENQVKKDIKCHCPRCFSNFAAWNERASPYLSTTKMATSPPVGHLWSDHKKVRCTCILPSCTVLVPSLNKIRPCMSEKWLGTHLSNKMATSRPSWIWSRKKWRAYVSYHSLPVCQVWTRWVNAYPRNGWGRVQHRVFKKLKWPPVGQFVSDLKKHDTHM